MEISVHLDKQQLFLEGHKELIHLVKWISNPIFYCEKGTVDYAEFRYPDEPGTIIYGKSPVGEAIEPIFKLSKEEITLILKTFCESHLRLNEKVKN